MTTDKVSASRELLNRIMQAICEGDASPEVEDAVNTCYQYIYARIDSVLREEDIQQPAAPDLSERYHAALVDIAGSKSITATPTQFCRELQRMASDALAEFPKPQKSKVVCGECHLKPAETCDICGAKQPDIRTQLLAYVPPLSEWPEWATEFGRVHGRYVFANEKTYNYHPEMRNNKGPFLFGKFYNERAGYEKLFSRAEVVAARGEV